VLSPANRLGCDHKAFLQIWVVSNFTMYVLIFWHRVGLCSAIFLKKIGSGMHRVSQNSVGEGVVLVISMPGRKVPKRCFGLRPSEKNTSETALRCVSSQKCPWTYVSVAFFHPNNFSLTVSITTLFLIIKSRCQF
jgi:hypothetical protein